MAKLGKQDFAALAAMARGHILWMGQSGRGFVQETSIELRRWRVKRFLKRGYIMSKTPLWDGGWGFFKITDTGREAVKEAR